MTRAEYLAKYHEAFLQRMAERISQTKACENCGKTFARNRHYDNSYWAKIRFCSQQCGSGRKRPMSPRERKANFETKYVPEPNSGCWLWLAGMSPDGYGTFRMGDGGGSNAHRAAWKLYIGPIPPGKSILHRCDNRACVNPDHLFVGTQYDNIADMNRKCRQAGAPGEKNPKCKLSEEQVCAIRADTRPNKIVAEEYGVWPTTIADIRGRETWRHVP